jgi:hypothetical protein
MKKSILFPFIILATALLFGSPQQVIDNPAEAKAKNAGRVLDLKEEFRITDEQGDFYFNSPKNFKLAPDGCLFVLDEDQFLKFSAEGKFLKNLYRKGQGPGELERAHTYLFSGDEIIMFQHYPGKIMRMDMEGKFIREFKLTKTLSKLVAFVDNRYILAWNSPPRVDKKGTEPEVIDIDWKIMRVSEDGTVEEIGPVFVAQWFAQMLPQGAMIANYIVDFSAVPLGKKRLVIHHDQDYRLKVFDIESGKVMREFGRKYRRVKQEKPKKAKEEGPVSLDPPVDYANDVQKVFVVEENILVMTSTIDKAKGILVDVFDSHGEYIDNYYLPVKDIALKDLSRYPITMTKDFLLIKEIGEDDLPSVVKYKILDTGLE